MERKEALIYLCDKHQFTEDLEYLLNNQKMNNVSLHQLNTSRSDRVVNSEDEEGTYSFE